MRRSPLLLALALLLLTACGDDGGSTRDEGDAFNPPASTSDDGPPPRPTDGPAPDIEDLPEGTVVFSPDDAETDTFGNETTWTPTAEDVEAVEQLLQDHLDENPDLGIDDLGTYHRQYVGTGEVGDIASVNALCEDADLDDWEDELILVNDGGSCFWQAEVSFFRLSVESFTVNGEA
jgi:hypothetical protein